MECKVTLTQPNAMAAGQARQPANAKGLRYSLSLVCCGDAKGGTFLKNKEAPEEQGSS